MVKPVGGGLERQFGLLPPQCQCARIKLKLKTLRSLDLGLWDMILQETLHQNATVVCAYIYIYVETAPYIYIYISHHTYSFSLMYIFTYALFQGRHLLHFKSVAGLFGVMWLPKCQNKAMGPLELDLEVELFALGVWVAGSFYGKWCEHVWNSYSWRQTATLSSLFGSWEALQPRCFMFPALPKSTSTDAKLWKSGFCITIITNRCSKTELFSQELNAFGIQVVYDFRFSWGSFDIQSFRCGVVWFEWIESMFQLSQSLHVPFSSDPMQDLFEHPEEVQFHGQRHPGPTMPCKVILDSTCQTSAFAGSLCGNLDALFC